MSYVDEDGKTHVNVYSKGKTGLGRFLSNFTRAPIDTEDGHFDSIEGYWYWLSAPINNIDRDKLRHASGWKAKKLGRELRAQDWVDDPEFKRKICAAIKVKLETNPEWFDKLKRLKPHIKLDHYYVYGDKVIKPKQGAWILEFLESMRK